MKHYTAAILSLAAMCALAALHTAFISRTADELYAAVDAAEAAYVSGDAQGASAFLLDALDEWQNGRYLSASLRHSELDGISSGIYDQLELISERADSCQTGFARLRWLIRRTAGSELPSLGSIF